MKRYRKLLAAFLIVAGLGLLLYPGVQMFLSKQNQSIAVARYEDGVLHYDEEEKREELKKAEEYNKSLTGTDLRDPFIPGSGVVIPDNYNEILDVDMGMMGTLEIPCIGVDLPVYHGVSEDVLKKGVGHMKETAFPVGGKDCHTVLSTHRGLPEAKLFTDLDKMQIGDEFYIRIFDETLAYEVDQIKVVEPDNTEYLKPVEGEDFATLLTCTPYGVNSHRLLVRGRRTEYVEEKAVQTVSRTVDREGQILAGAAVFWLLFLASCFWKSRKKKKRQRRKAG